MVKEDKMKEIYQSLEEGVAEIYESGTYKNFLDVMSRFHRYSLNNQILIKRQKPEATRVAGYNDWKKKFNRHVKAKEKGITILAPQKYTVNIPTEECDEYGNVIYEKKSLIHYIPVSVFDISQTAGEELPALAVPLTGDVPEYNKLMAACKSVSDFDVGFEDLKSGNGYCDFTNRIIRIKTDMSQAQTLKTLIHEIAHEKLHASVDDRKMAEVQAESVAYVVCSYFNLDTSDYSFGYVASWAGNQDNQVLKENLADVRNGAKELIGTISANLENQKEAYISIESDIGKKANDVLREAGMDALVNNVYIYSFRSKEGIISSVSAITEYSGNAKEEEVFNVLNGTLGETEGIKVDVNPLNSDMGIDEPYTERLDRYEELGYDSTWPMVSIVYSNMGNIPTHYININEAVELINKIDDDAISNPLAYLKVKISYTYNDWKYEHVQDLDIGKGRMNFIDYLKLPPNIISHLKAHNSIMDKCRKAMNLAPDTTYGNEYMDKILIWAEYCRMELNHNSEKPVIPCPPQIFTVYHEMEEDWRLER